MIFPNEFIIIQALNEFIDGIVLRWWSSLRKSFHLNSRLTNSNGNEIKSLRNSIFPLLPLIQHMEKSLCFFKVKFCIFSTVTFFISLQLGFVFIAFSPFVGAVVVFSPRKLTYFIVLDFNKKYFSYTQKPAKCSIQARFSFALANSVFFIEIFICRCVIWRCCIFFRVELLFVWTFFVCRYY